VKLINIYIFPVQLEHALLFSARKSVLYGEYFPKNHLVSQAKVHPLAEATERNQCKYFINYLPSS